MSRLNLNDPRNRVDHTAVVIMEYLSNRPGEEISAAELDRHLINSADGHFAQKYAATWALRNAGYPLIVHKAGSKSWSKWDPTPAEHEEGGRSVMWSTYDQLVLRYHAIPREPGYESTRRCFQGWATAIGLELGLSVAEVMQQMELLSA